MGSRHVNAALCAELTDGERDFRCWTQALKEICLDAVGGEDSSYGLSIHASVVATVVTDDGGKVLAAWEGLEHVVGKALCCHTYDILVHAVGSRTHDAAQSASTEFQYLIECVDESCGIWIVKHSLNFLTCFLVKCG